MQSFICKPRKRITVVDAIYSVLFVIFTETAISSGQSLSAYFVFVQCPAEHASTFSCLLSAVSTQNKEHHYDSIVFPSCNQACHNSKNNTAKTLSYNIRTDSSKKHYLFLK